MPPDVNGHSLKLHGPIRMVLEEGHGNEIFLRIYIHSLMCPRTIGTGFMDDKDASRTIRMGFTDRYVVSHAPCEVTERRFLMDESIYKGHLAWLLFIHILHFDEDTSIQQLYNRYWSYLRIYFAEILSQS